MPLSNYFKILNIPKTVSISQLRLAYRQLALQFHPDVNKEKKATEVFRQITDAYNVILTEKLKNAMKIKKSHGPFTGVIPVHTEFDVIIQNEWHSKYNKLHRISVDSNVNDLNELGFNQSDYIRQRVFVCLEAYKRIQHNLLIHVDFIVPYQDTRFPSDCWGLKLGVVVQNIRLYDYLTEYKQQLQTMGISYYYSDKQVLHALKTFKLLHNHLVVHRKFVIPYNDRQWDKQIGGMKLGKIVDNIRNNNAYSEYKDVLVELGFMYNDSTRVDGNSVLKECV